jgi:molybdate transport system ATP-binding protein
MWDVILNCRLPLADFVLDIDASFRSRVTAIFGPSGAGKTSLLDTIAGLRTPLAGEIRVGSRLLYSAARGINVAPQQRAIGYVPQENALFPHLSVRKNILFGARRREILNPSAGMALEHVAELLEIDHLLERPVTRLSGGEAQRVALARALLSHPDLLLLDEPLASLDIGLKERILPYLRKVRDEFAIPMIYVSHNPTEVLALADWVVLIREGRVIAQGRPHDALASRLALSVFEDDDVENVFDAQLIESEPQAGTSRVRLETGLELVIPCQNQRPGASLQIRIRGDDILIATQRPEEISASNVFPGKITDIEIMDGECVVTVEAGGSFSVRLTAAAAKRLGLATGADIFLIVKARSCLVL